MLASAPTDLPSSPPAMSRPLPRISAVALPALLLALPAGAATRNLVWANNGPDMNDAANWLLPDGSSTTAPPTSEDRLYFSGVPGVQPRLTATMQVLAVRFGETNTWAATAASADDGLDGYNYSGWTISGDAGAELVLPGRWSEGKNWNFAFSQSTFGTNVVDGVLCGDVDYDAVSAVADAVTPVPGGVGTVTTSVLLQNTVTAAGHAAGGNTRP